MYTIYSTKTCPYCIKAKQYLTNRGLPYEEVVLTSPADVAVLSERVGYPVKTVPQIWHGETYVGGFDKLQTYIN